MTTVEKMLIDLDPETMVLQVMSDPNHKARVRARIAKDRAVRKAKRKKAHTRWVITCAEVAVLALFAGYCLAFV